MPEIFFNAYTIIFMNIAFFGLVFSLFLIFKQGIRNKAYLLLGLFTLITSYQVFEYDLYWTNLITKFPHLSSVSGILNFAIPPLFFLFFRSLFDYRNLSSKDLLHFVPFLIVVLMKLPYLTLSASEKFQFTFESNTLKYLHTLIIPWLAILQMSVYLFVMQSTLNRNSEIGKVKRLGQLFIYFFLLLILSMVFYHILIHFSWFNPLWDYNITLLLCICILASGWFGIMSPSVFNGLLLNEFKESVKSYNVNTNYILSSNSISKESPALQHSKSFVVKSNAIHDDPIQPISEAGVQIDQNSKSEPSGKYKNSGLTESAADELKSMLELFMSNSKYFKESNVSLEELSKKLNTTRHNLSQVINEKYNMHFFDYINHLRINEAVFIMQNDKANKLQISEIAFSVGYNNKTTFNNSFKKFLGKTPSAYRVELKDFRH